MKNYKCIIFCGWKGSGKDTCANFYMKKYQNLFFQTAFANSVKDKCSNRYGVKRSAFDDIILKDQKIDSIGLSPRDMCLIVGKEGRDLDIDYWVKKTIEDIKVNIKKKICLITDCRFPNEMKYMKEYFGKDDVLTIWIYRFDKNSSTDETENSLSSKDCNYIIENKKGLDDLYDKLLTLFSPHI